LYRLIESRLLLYRFSIAALATVIANCRDEVLRRKLIFHTFPTVQTTLFNIRVEVQTSRFSARLASTKHISQHTTNILFKHIVNCSWNIFFQLCILYNQRDATYTMFFYYYQRSTYFGRFFRPSSGAYKTVCAASGIAMLSYCVPLV